MTAWSEVLTEIGAARSKFPPFHGAHEGYAVILEELDELWDEVKKHSRDPKAVGRSQSAEQ